MPTDTEQRKGILFALAAYNMRGLVPNFFKSVDHLSPFDVDVMTRLHNYTSDKLQYRFVMHKVTPDQPRTIQG
ncbi:hypothetical protein [Amphritea balenae]|uniref:Uncharacterized protein n=1 Tax=Amphritea balenae TaxID=452629 RepID=A0A3P1SX21_9GAMM|nr:hypothetical protein [Amphritea balenae]RRD01792.1 hypothetical protein EHS89_04435 [Amphritea balenae]GGK53971.1 hypothetical protein GCM10007941_00030 [Amphritea balenae]